MGRDAAQVQRRKKASTSSTADDSREDDSREEETTEKPSEDTQKELESEVCRPSPIYEKMSEWPKLVICGVILWLGLGLLSLLYVLEARGTGEGGVRREVIIGIIGFFVFV